MLSAWNESMASRRIYYSSDIIARIRDSSNRGAILRIDCDDVGRSASLPLATGAQLRRAYLTRMVLEIQHDTPKTATLK